MAEDDALAYLEKQEMVGGIFAGQLIEHLKFNQIVQLCELAYEKLEDGAYIIMETPNPMSVGDLYSCVLHGSIAQQADTSVDDGIFYA